MLGIIKKGIENKTANVLLPLYKSMLCTEVPGCMKQIDAGNGEVIGLDEARDVYVLYEGNWLNVSGGGPMKHVSVGPVGMWAVDSQNYIYRLVGGSWQKTTGLLAQLDAGGDLFVGGVNFSMGTWCLSRPGAILQQGSPVLPWTYIGGKFALGESMSCGWRGCWGVNAANEVWFHHGIWLDKCKGTRWVHVPGSLNMIEIGTDGNVYGVNSLGHAYRW
uniref:Uncharacterized protein n=1 Tax=Pelusios castaneus TaxID=367368 RepID=A0A8C8SSB0_9SAUR